MRNVILLSALLAAPALAQTPPTPPPAPPHARAAKPKPRPTPVVAAPHAAPRIAHAPPAAPAPAPVLATPAPAPPPEPGRGTVTGQPVPRWAAFRSDEVNLRAGPGTRYPIDWVYHRRDLPVQIEREFEVWRLVEDQDGVKGWVHQATLVGRRGFVVKSARAAGHPARRRRRRRRAGRDPQARRGRPRARLRRAKAAWCEMQVGDYRGWLQAGLWSTA